MMDLVINHTAFDSPLVTEHPDWYKRGADGKPLHPSARMETKKSPGVIWLRLITRAVPTVIVYGATGCN